MELEQSTPVVEIKGLVQSSMKAPDFYILEDQWSKR